MVSIVPKCVTYSYADACRNIFNTIRTSGHSSLEKYTSHFIWKGSKGIICERWVGDWTELQHIDPRTLLATAAFLSRSPDLLNWGPGGPASAGTWFSFQHLLFNIWLPVAPGLYNYLTSTRLLWASHLHSIQPVDSQGNPWYLRMDAPVYTGAFLLLTAWSGSVCYKWSFI